MYCYAFSVRNIICHTYDNYQSNFNIVLSRFDGYSFSWDNKVLYNFIQIVKA